MVMLLVVLPGGDGGYCLAVLYHLEQVLALFFLPAGGAWQDGQDEQLSVGHLQAVPPVVIVADELKAALYAASDCLHIRQVSLPEVILALVQEVAQRGGEFLFV